VERLKTSRKSILMLIDTILINLAYLLAYSFRFNFQVPSLELTKHINNAIIITIIYIIIFYIFNLYKSLWYYASTDEFLLAVGGCITANLLALLYTVIVNNRTPFSISILAGVFTTLLVVGFRICFRIYRNKARFFDRADKNDFKRVMIIGAGAAGNMTIKEMKLHPEMRYKPVALIDIDKRKMDTRIGGVKVFGDRQSIEKTVVDEKVDIILLAIPSIDYKNKKEILNICKKTGCKVEIIPGIFELIDGKVSLKKVRDVSYEDLLGRAPVKLDTPGIEKYIKGKTVMITGGGGSIGSEICRQIASLRI